MHSLERIGLRGYDAAVAERLVAICVARRGVNATVLHACNTLLAGEEKLSSAPQRTVPQRTSSTDNLLGQCTASAFRWQDEVETSIDDDDVFTASTKLAVRIHFADGTLRAAKVSQICMARL